MEKKEFFSKINFNKNWEEDDWEKFFEAQDAYRVSAQTNDIRKKPASRIKFIGTDEVAAFEPVFREYGMHNVPPVFQEIREKSFHGDENPEEEYHPHADEDPHYWVEGAPLATLLIYRDCCRYAICTAQELDKYLKRKDAAYRKKFSAEFESLRFHANWIAINVAEGHILGYSPERIKGNIGKCRRALKHADICLGLLSRISLRTKSVRLRLELFSFSLQVRNALFSWIDELRERTWLA